ncbi:hypothetical protein [Nitrospira sp. T9]
MLVFGVLAIGGLFAMVGIPLAVSQPVTIPIASITGDIAMDAANPILESVPGVVVPLSGQTIATPMHPTISVKTVMVKMATKGNDIGIRATVANNWFSNEGLLGHKVLRSNGHPISGSGFRSAPPLSVHGSIGRNRQYLAMER